MSSSGDASLTARVSIKDEADHVLIRINKSLIETGKSANISSGQVSALENRLSKLSSTTSKAAIDISNFAQQMEKTRAGSNSATAGMTKLAESMTRTGAVGGPLNNAFNQVNANLEKTAKNAASLSDRFVSSVTAYSTAAISVWGLYNAYDNLEKVQLQAERSAIAAQKAQTRLSSLQESYKEGLAKGNLTEEEAAIMKQKIADQTDALRLAQEKAAIAADDYKEILAGFATQVLPFVVTSGVAVVNMIHTMKAAQISGTVSTITLTGAVRGLGAALKGLLLNPLLAPLLAIAAAMTAFATNAFGVADAINSIGVAIGNALPFLKPLLELLGGFGNFIRGISGDTVDSTEMMSKGFDDMSDSSIASMNSLEGKVSSSTDKISEDLDKAYKKLLLFQDFGQNEDGSLKVKVDIAGNEDIQKKIREITGNSGITIPYAFEINTAKFSNDIEALFNGNKEDFKIEFGDITDENFFNLLKSAGVGLDQIKEAAQGVGGAFEDSNGNIHITEKSFDLIVGKLEQIEGVGKLTEEKIKAIREALGTKINILPGTENMIAIGGMMIDLDKNTEVLNKSIDELSKTFEDELLGSLNLISQDGRFEEWLTTQKEELKKFAEGSEEQKKAHDELSQVISKGLTTASKGVNDFFNATQKINDPTQIINLARIHTNYTQDIDTAWDHLSGDMLGHQNTINDAISGSALTMEQKTNLMNGIMNNNIKLFEGMPEHIKTAAIEITKYGVENANAADKGQIFVDMLVDYLKKLADVDIETDKATKKVKSFEDALSIVRGSNKFASGQSSHIIDGIFPEGIEKATKAQLEEVLQTIPLIKTQIEEANSPLEDVYLLTWGMVEEKVKSTLNNVNELADGKGFVRITDDIIKTNDELLRLKNNFDAMMADSNNEDFAVASIIDQLLGGKGVNVGSKFEEIARFIDTVSSSSKKAEAEAEAFMNTLGIGLGNTLPEIDRNIQAVDTLIGIYSSFGAKGEDTVKLLELIRSKLESGKQTISDTNASNIKWTNSIYDNAVALGMSEEKLEEINNAKKDLTFLTDEQIAKYQQEQIAITTSNEFLTDSVNFQNNLRDAIIQTNISINDQADSLEIGIQTEEAAIDQWLRLIELAGGEVPAALELTSENLEIVYKASIGAKDGIEELAEVMNKTAVEAGGLTQSQAEATNSVIDMARSAGVAKSVLDSYNNEIAQTGFLSESSRNQVLRLASSQLDLRLANMSVSRSQEQVNIGLVLGKQQAIDFFNTTQIQTVQTAQYVKILTDRLLQMGYTMAQINSLGTLSNLEAFFKAATISADAGKAALKQLSDSFSGKDSEDKKDKQKKQKIDREQIREQAIQQAIEEAGAINHLVKKLIDETTAVSNLALKVGVGVKAMKDFKKSTDEFGIASEKAILQLLKLTAAESDNIKFLTNSNSQLKDKYMAMINGATAANDYTREIRQSIIAEAEQEKQLLKITKALGISLPDSLDATVENLENLIGAAYGSKTAMRALQDSAVEVGEFYRDVINDAKDAITDAKFEEFVKKELLFSGVGDEFFRNIARELQSEMKLEKIADQMTKQLSLIQLNPDMFRSNATASELKSGVESTIMSIEAAINGNPRLQAAWQPILDSLNSVVNSPDIHTAIQDFADKFPNVIEPALTGVNIALQGVDTQINTTFDDSKKEDIKDYEEATRLLKEESKSIEKELIKEAKANQAVADSADDAAKSIKNMRNELEDYFKVLSKVQADFSNTDIVSAKTGVPADFGATETEAIQNWKNIEQTAINAGVNIENNTEKVSFNIATKMKLATQGMGIDILTFSDEGSGRLKNLEDYSKGSTDNMTKYFNMFSSDGTELVSRFGHNSRSTFDKDIDKGSKKHFTNAEGHAKTSSGGMGGQFILFANLVNHKIMPSILLTMQSAFNALPNIATPGIAGLHMMFDQLVKKAGLTVTNINSKFATMKTHYTITIDVKYNVEDKPSALNVASGFSGIVDRETHFTAGEAGRPEIVSVIPLSYDFKRATGKLEGGQFSANIPIKSMNRSGSVAVETKAFNGRSGGNRPVIVNNYNVVMLGNKEIKREITSQTFDDYDNQI